MKKTKKEIVFNLWNPIVKNYKEDIQTIKNSFPINKIFFCEYHGSSSEWEEFLIDYYALASDPPGDVSTVKQDKMRQKARHMLKYGNQFLTIILDIKKDQYRTKSKKGNPWEPINVGLMKNKIRDKYTKLGYNRWEISHCFESHLYTQEIINFLKDKCEIHYIRLQ